MKNNFKYSLIVIALIATCFSSCKKYLDRNPLSSISQRDFYSNGAQVQQALVGVYNAFGARTISPGFSNPTTYYAKMDLYTELGIERGLSGTIGSGSYDPTNGTVAELWAGFFQVVQRANNLLFYMTKAESVMVPAEYKRVIAEAKVKIDDQLTGNPSSRRHGFKVYFNCEGCSVRSILSFSQHKGTTYVAFQPE